MKSTLPAVAVVLGIVLLLGSALWALIFPPSRSWTEEKATRLTELGNRATALQLQLDQAKARPSMHSGLNPAELKAEQEQVEADYKALYQEFASASNSPKTAASFLRWAGIAFIAAGALVVMATRGS
jgi:hypothetical protein